MARSRVLVVDDDSDIRLEVAGAVADLGYDVVSYASALDALKDLDSLDVDVVLTDLRMPSVDGIELCETVARNYDAPVVLMTAFGEVRAAVDAMRADAFDFLIKPFDLEELADVLERAVRRRGDSHAVRKLTVESADQDFSAIVGSSAATRELVKSLARIATSSANVLITGESGTGKELIARALHDNGPRRNGRFVAVNCAAVPASILESELFGHTRGAFTGATGARRGLFAEANGGTLLLDEIGTMPIELQPALLRALQERAVRPIGGSVEERFDARIIAATNGDLEQCVARGTFREDLLFRLDVLHVYAPPLRDRGDDVVELSLYFLAVHAKRLGRAELVFDDDALAALRSYSWPGNVQELRNSVEGAVALSRGNRIEFGDLSPAVRRPSRRAPVDDGSSLGHLQREHIERVLEAVGGNIARAARVLGIDRGTLYRRIRRFRPAQKAR